MDFARRAYVIRRYIQLQGLELLPLGALFLAKPVSVEHLIKTINEHLKKPEPEP